MKRILLVTERCSKHGLPLSLVHAGYDVVEPRVPSEATKVIKNTHVDMVVIGHCVPERRRETLAHLIRNMRPDLPIICVTEDPIRDQPTSGSVLITSCSTMLWAIEHTVRNNQKPKADAYPSQQHPCPPSEQ